MGELIVITDTDEDSAQDTAVRFREVGYAVRHAPDGTETLALLRAQPPRLLLLSMDLAAPRSAEVLRRIRRESTTASLPVIAFGASNDEIDRVLAFELGADDYVARPFSPRELVLRVRALLRRTSTCSQTVQSTRIQAGPIEVDTRRRRVTVHGQPIVLTAIELSLLSDLAARAGHVQQREKIIERIWPDRDLGHRAVDTHVRRLREKLGDAADWIETVRGVGYRIRVSDAHGEASRV